MNNRLVLFLDDEALGALSDLAQAEDRPVSEVVAEAVRVLAEQRRYQLRQSEALSTGRKAWRVGVNPN
jgi:hypothetical protein